MSYVDEGPRTPEAVLLLHGIQPGRFFYRIRSPTSDSRATLRGARPHRNGASAKPQDYPYRLETHIANLEGVVNGLG